MNIQTIAQRHQWHALIAAVSLAVGLVIGVLIPIQSPIQIPDQYEATTKYHFINPLLECGDDDFSRIQNGQMLDLKGRVDAYVTQEQQNGTLNTASVYFRELNGGQFFESNPQTQFIPASLLKVALAMSVYLQAEHDPKLLSKKVFFAPNQSVPMTEYFTAPTITASSTYTVEQLLQAMLVNSDNNAAMLLTQQISAASLDETYSDLGISVPQNEQYAITIGTSASFFRVLYNATYLNHDDSEHLLDLLSQTKFTQGIVAGVPPGTTVAHKFGERGYGNADPNQLHDCGIVYAKQPYLLCVMTQGNDFNDMAAAIAQISHIVYEYAGQ